MGEGELGAPESQIRKEIGNNQDLQGKNTEVQRCFDGNRRFGPKSGLTVETGKRGRRCSADPEGDGELPSFVERKHAKAFKTLRPFNETVFLVSEDLSFRFSCRSLKPEL